jgi:hypothetical protein
MNTTQSIIVYRSPAEAMLWESGMVFPLIASLVVFVVVLVATMKVVDSFRWKNRRTKEWVGYGVMLVAAIASVVTFNHLMI